MDSNTADTDSAPACCCCCCSLAAALLLLSLLLLLLLAPLSLPCGVEAFFNLAFKSPNSSALYHAAFKPMPAASFRPQDVAIYMNTTAWLCQSFAKHAGVASTWWSLMLPNSALHPKPPISGWLLFA
jgi:hypothetical protein